MEKERLDTPSKSVDKVKVSGSPTRCPYCHDDVDGQSPALVCQSCLSRHHQGCWTELGRCGSCGEEAALESSAIDVGARDDDVCRCCGLHGRREYTCPQCNNGSCGRCYRPRFRRCVECSVELIQAERHLKMLKERKSNFAALGVLCVLFALAALICSIVFMVLGGELALGVYIALPLLPIFVLAAWWGLSEDRKLASEVESYELQLAPYERSLTDALADKVRHFTRRVRSTFRERS